MQTGWLSGLSLPGSLVSQPRLPASLGNPEWLALTAQSRLRLLRLAAHTLESDVAAALRLLLEGQERWDETDVERLTQRPATNPATTPIGLIPGQPGSV